MTPYKQRTDHRAMDGHDPKCATFRALPMDLTEFSIPAGKAYLSPVIDCYDGHAGRVDDRHQPERGIGQRHARRRVLHAQGRGAADHPFRPWLPLPVARVDPHLQGAWSDAFDERERLFSGQRGRGGVLRPSQAGVLP